MTETPAAWTPPGSAPPDPGIEAGLTPLEVLGVLIRRWRAVILLPVIAGVLIYGVTLLMQPVYTAATSVVPESPSRNRLPASVAGLAGQFGISLAGDASRSAEFYAQVARGREVLERLLLSEVPDPRPGAAAGDSIPVLALLPIEGRSRADSIERGIRHLRGTIAVRVDAGTSILQISADSPYPPVAAALANRIVDYLNDFNATARRSQAGERRRFAESRLVPAESDLREAEEALRRFVDQNRRWEQSPELVIEQGRLRRQVDIQQEVYLTLRREYETSRIEEVNDAPIITVIDRAVIPQWRSKPKRTVLAFVGFVTFALGGIIWAFAADYAARARRQEAREYEEIRTLLHGVRDLLRSSLRRIPPQHTP